MKENFTEQEKKRADFIGLEVKLGLSGKNARGWIQEVTTDGQEFILALYPDGQEVKGDWDDIDQESLYGPPLPVLEGFVAIDFVGEDDVVSASIRIPQSDYQAVVNAAKSLGQDFETFFSECLIAGAKEVIEENSVDK